MSTPQARSYGYEIEEADRILGSGASAQRFPVIVYLHGVGEIGGNKFTQVRRHGPWKNGQFNQNVRDRLGQYFVVAPHLDENSKQWDVQRLLATLSTAFDEIRKKTEGEIIDLDRMYVTGNSLGGRGALGLAFTGLPHPRSQSETLYFRAAAIICPSGGARGLSDRTRYQFFHRANDTNRNTRGTYLSFARAQNAAFWTYQGCSHNCWTATYANPALYEWFNDPGAPVTWGTACDYGMCAEDANELINVGKSIRAPFCSRHAREYEAADWVAAYKKKLQTYRE